MFPQICKGTKSSDGEKQQSPQWFQLSLTTLSLLNLENKTNIKQPESDSTHRTDAYHHYWYFSRLFFNFWQLWGRLQVSYIIVWRLIWKFFHFCISIFSIRQRVKNVISTVILSAISSIAVVYFSFIQHANIHHVNVLQVIQTCFNVLL